MYNYTHTQVKEQLFYNIFAYCVILLHKQSRVCHFPINTVNLKYVNLRPYIFKVGCKFLMYRRYVYVVFVFLLFHLRIECIFCSCLLHIYYIPYHIVGAIISELDPSDVHCGFESGVGQTNG